MHALGKHLLLELKDCNRKTLNSSADLRSILLKAAGASGVAVLGESFHEFQPQGVSGIVTIAESHLFIHTWPEHGYASFDIFTCGDRVIPEKAAEVIIKELEAKNYSILDIQRGIVDD